MSATTTSDYTVADQQRMSRARRYFAWQAQMSEAELGRRVLEIGCGIGNFTQALVERERVIAIDVDEECLRLHRERFASYPNVDSLLLDALDPAFLELARYDVDSIACLNVLEHLEDDRLVLERAARILPTGGRIVLLVPAFPSLYGPIDANLGHFRRYTKESLRSTARAAGLRPRTLRYVNSVGFLGWWANARLFRREEQSEGQIAVFDDVVVPVLSRLEGAVEPPFGQSIFAVLER